MNRTYQRLGGGYFQMASTGTGSKKVYIHSLPFPSFYKAEIIV